MASYDETFNLLAVHLLEQGRKCVKDMKYSTANLEAGAMTFDPIGKSLGLDFRHHLSTVVEATIEKEAESKGLMRQLKRFLAASNHSDVVIREFTLLHDHEPVENWPKRILALSRSFGLDYEGKLDDKISKFNFLIKVKHHDENKRVQTQGIRPRNI